MGNPDIQIQIEFKKKVLDLIKDGLDLEANKLLKAKLEEYEPASEVEKESDSLDQPPVL